jgi:hypothetical protein
MKVRQTIHRLVTRSPCQLTGSVNKFPVTSALTLPYHLSVQLTVARAATPLPVHARTHLRPTGCSIRSAGSHFSCANFISPVRWCFVFTVAAREYFIAYCVQRASRNDDAECCQTMTTSHTHTHTHITLLISAARRLADVTLCRSSPSSSCSS